MGEAGLKGAGRISVTERTLGDSTDATVALRSDTQVEQRARGAEHRHQSGSVARHRAAAVHDHTDRGPSRAEAYVVANIQVVHRDKISQRQGREAPSPALAGVSDRSTSHICTGRPIPLPTNLDGIRPRTEHPM